MKKWIAVGTGLLIFLLAGVTACNPLGEGEEIQQPVAVTRSDLYISVSGSGNIEASEEAKLTFGSSGRLDTINVEKGDIVNQGELLAALETDALELAETQAEVALAQAEVAVTSAAVALVQAQLAEQTAEYNLKNTRDTEDTLALALFNAQIATKSAEHHVGETQDIYTWPDIETAQKDVDNAKAFLEYALDSGLPELTLCPGQINRR
jgi:multidrug efflux pump subunit AcrA (membrane-fusion protein)